MYTYEDFLNSAPAVRRGWGGENGTELMLELMPHRFAAGKAMVAIEAGYVGTSKDGDAEEWVKDHCSGLVLDKAMYDDGSGMMVFDVHFDEKAVKADSPGKYMVHGPGGGEYRVLIFTVEPAFEMMYEETFSCK